MQLKVKERFYDKVEGIYEEKGAEIARDGKRAQELIAAGVAEPIVEKKPEKEKKAPKKKAEEKPAE